MIIGLTACGDDEVVGEDDAGAEDVSGESDTHVEPTNTFTVTPLVGANGSISPNTAQTVNQGESTSFTISPDEGYRVDVVGGCDGALEGDTYTTGEITADCTVSASFVELPPAPSAAILSAEGAPTSVTLSWSGDGDTFNLFDATEPECDTANHTLCDGGTLITDVTSPFTVTGLATNQNYWFRLSSANSSGTALSNEAGARTMNMSPNGTVRALATGEDGTTYLGGDFTAIGPNTGYGAPISQVNGQLIGAFPAVNGVIHAAISDGAGGWFIGGAFTLVEGIPRNHLAHIRANGTLSDWNPDANSTVLALAVSGSTVYAGGNFTSMGGEARNYLAAIDADGTLSDWSPDANNRVFAFAVSGSTVNAGGAFTTIGGNPMPYLAPLVP